MRETYPWDDAEPYEFNLAVNKIPPLMDKLYAMHEPANYLAVADRWYDDWRDAPGSIMVQAEVPIHEKEDALRRDFVPVARYVDHIAHPRLRYEALLTFVVTNAIEADRWLWCDSHGQPLSFPDLLPQAIADTMFDKWLDQRKPHSGALKMLILRSIDPSAA